jgi:hypothetical protein
MIQIEIMSWTSRNEVKEFPDGRWMVRVVTRMRWSYSKGAERVK